MGSHKAWVLGFVAIGLLSGACTPQAITVEGTPASVTTPATSIPSGASSIPIGVAFSQTSNYALLAQESIIGARIAERYFNDRGGVKGQPIQLIFQDTGGDEAGAINAFQTLINQNQVVGIVGPSASQQAFSANPIAERAKVPVIGASNTADGIPDLGDYIARVSAPVSVVAPQAIRAALTLNPKIQKVAVFYAQNDAFTTSETKIFQKAAQALGLEIVTVQAFQTTDTDFQAQATQALSFKPDLAIVSALAADGGNLVRQLRELGYKNLIIGGNGLNTSNIFPVCQKWCQGLIIAQAYSPEYNNKINQDFRQVYKTQSNKEPPQFSAQAFTAVQVYVEALRVIADQKDLSHLPLEDLREELNQTLLAGTYETPLGEISFAANGEIQQKQFYVAQIQMNGEGTNGTFQYLEVK